MNQSADTQPPTLPDTTTRRADAACLINAATPLLWLPQAALLALAVAGLQSGAGLNGVLAPAAGIVLLGVVRALLEAWSAQKMFTHARAQLSQWRKQSIDTLAARSPLDRTRMAAGAAASALAEQAESILPWLTRYRRATLRLRIVPTLIVALVAWYSWAAALVLLFAAPLIPMFMAIVGWRAKAASEEQWLQMSSMNAYLLDRLRGMPTLRALGCIDSTAHRLRANAEDLRTRTMRVLRIAFLSSAVLELFAALGVAMVAAYIGFHLLGTFTIGTWGQRLSLAEGLFVLLLAPAFFEPLRELASVWHDKASGEAAIDALHRLNQNGLLLPDRQPADAPASPRKPTAPHTVAQQPAAISVRGLDFSFPDGEPVFRDFNLQIEAGEHVALMGPSGAGKTVLMALLAGLLRPTAGTIQIDGESLTAESARRLRRRMAWMGQRPHVFSGSVFHNVALGRQDMTRALVRQTIDWARLDSVAQAHPGVSLGEGGTGLSMGEGARLALARMAGARQANLMLLDEPTAHLDAETAEQVMQALLELGAGRTLVVATHDPALAARMDRVVQMPTPLETAARPRQAA